MWYGHEPFSENAQLMQNIEQYSNTGKPGRFIFRIDEWIQPAGCSHTDFGLESKTIRKKNFKKVFYHYLINIKEKLNIWPRYANMLGGQEVNITGPCYDENPFFLCKWGDSFDAPITIGETPIPMPENVSSVILGRCVQPVMYYNGILNLSLSLDGGKTFDWKAEYTIGNKT
jgi:sushi domain-containing protein 2